MPVLKIKTVDSRVGWTNPSNPDMVSYDLTIDVEGKKAEARTYSQPISVVGFEGEVETYEKNEHTYLRQVKKDFGGGFTPRRSFGGPSKDNSDGQRQGMCINNAANYINTNNTKELSAVEWAKIVHSYASELYNLGDINKSQPNKVDVVADVNEDKPIDLSDIEDIFGPTQKG